ncbi:hypothetical protein HDU76_000279 [Blyttiomyces sp. JEL0837]|nr:hypothetical protein HDU76_000279 [Blyttiomyces sp. JEL0837]
MVGSTSHNTPKPKFSDLPVEVLLEIVKCLPPSKEIFTQVALISKRFYDSIKLSPVCISCTLTLAPNCNDLHKQVFWINNFTKSAFKSVKVLRATTNVNAMGKSASVVGNAGGQPYEAVHMISVADCHASVPLQAVVHQDPEKIIELLKLQIEMSYFVASRPTSSVKVYFERFDTTGLGLDVSNDAKQVAKFAAVLGASTFEFQWRRTLIRYLNQSSLNLVIHGTPSEPLQDLHQLSKLAGFLRQLEFKPNASLKSVDGVDRLGNLRVLKVPVIAGMASVGEYFAQHKLPALQSVNILHLNDSNEIFSRIKGGLIPAHTNPDQLQDLHIKLSNLDAFTLSSLAEIVAHYFSKVTVLVVYFESFAAANLPKNQLSRILRRVECSTAVEKLVFVTVTYYNTFSQAYLPAPSALAGFGRMEVTLSNNFIA